MCIRDRDAPCSADGSRTEPEPACGAEEAEDALRDAEEAALGTLLTPVSYTHLLAGTADLCHAHSAQGNCRYGCGGTNDAQNKTGNQECKTFQTTFHNTVPP